MLCQEPELAITIDSESDEKARKLLSPLEAVLSGDDKYAQFGSLYGSWYNPNREWTKSALVIGPRRNLSRKEPSIGATSVDKGLTMQHPDVFILDDPTSYEKIRAVSNWMEVVNEHVDAMDPIFGQGTLWLWPGTRYGDTDHYGVTLKAEGVASVTGEEIPDIDVTPDGEWHVFYLPAITPEGKLTMPHIWSRKRIENWERRNPIRCAAQVKLDPFEASINPLTRAQADRCLVPDDDSIPWRMMDFTFHYDLAFKRPDRIGKGDQTAFVVWGHMRDGSGELVLWGAYASNGWSSEDLANRTVIEYQNLKQKGCYVKLQTCEQEGGGAAGMWQNTLQNAFAKAGIIMPQFEYLRRAGRHADKNERLIGAAAFWRDGKVKLPIGRPGAQELLIQMTRILGGKRKDVADAAADAFNPVVYRAMRARAAEQSPVPVGSLHDELLKGNLEVTEYMAGKIIEEENVGFWFDPI